MDTRSKIVEIPRIPSGATVVTGYFDGLRAEHARELQKVRERALGRPLAVLVLSRRGQLLEERARATMAAALRTVDFVAIVSHEKLPQVLETLQPAEIVRFEEAQSRWMDEMALRLRHSGGPQSSTC